MKKMKRKEMKRKQGGFIIMVLTFVIGLLGYVAIDDDQPFVVISFGIVFGVFIGLAINWIRYEFLD